MKEKSRKWDHIKVTREVRKDKLGNERVVLRGVSMGYIRSDIKSRAKANNRKELNKRGVNPRMLIAQRIPKQYKVKALIRGEEHVVGIKTREEIKTYHNRKEK